ncbi:hypothetical protein ES332_D13G029400v1 [Gossypium tomentosum]|uniref:Acid phosphatase n=1 Tax=Gossypium tomentosum TaxID=34277 RepID=A0A5D2HRW0_GOSTO|nr:hypothetical protein ES332_D13G029400v1 [Gossypium tomentosum]
MLGKQYRKDSRAVAKEAFLYAQSLKLAGDGKDIWIFDIDETTLSNTPYYAQHGFGAEPYNATLFDKWVMEGAAPALPESLWLYNKLLSLGIKVVFLTGRHESQRNTTASNLKNVGYHAWNKLILNVENHQNIQGKQQYFTSQRRGKCWRRKGTESLEIWVINGVISWGPIPVTGRSNCRIQCITLAEDISPSCQLEESGH